MLKMAKLSFQHVSCLLLIFLATNSEGRKHKLKLENDSRKQIDLTTFGFLKGGYLMVNLTEFSFMPKDTKEISFGFTLDKTTSTGISPYLESKSACALTDDTVNDEKAISVIFFRMDLKTNRLKIERKGDDVRNLSISQLSEGERNMFIRPKRSLHVLSDSFLFERRRRRRDVEKEGENDTKEKKAATSTAKPTPTASTATTSTPTAAGKSVGKSTPTASPPTTTTPPPGGSIEKSGENIAPSEAAVDVDLPLNYKKVENSLPITCNPITGCHFYFVIDIACDAEEGLYSLFFHNCGNYEGSGDGQVNFTAYLVEKNPDNYLSAGQMPLPTIYFVLSLVFLFVGFYWVWILKSATEGVFKTHFLMSSLVFVKSISLLFHGVNYYFIGREGHHEEAFAILWYITYLMKGTLLFVTIVLIGAGWAFVKHILSDRDKKIFCIVIPLQCLAQIAQIIIEETEEGQSQYTTWKEIFILVDLLCCGAILFPVVWSIRHLQEASQTDGKAAINLAKLKIFRHFYILIVCYIYFTRIIVYLLKITVPFQYEWMNELFKELATLAVFVITGYKFRPSSENPYLQISQEEDDEVEMDEVLTKSAAYEGVTKVNVKTTSTEPEKGPKMREASHEYD